MLTTFELSKKLAELNTEFCKMLSTNDGAELLRWVGVAMEFTEALLAESVDSGSLTQNERGAILAAKASSKSLRQSPISFKEPGREGMALK